MRLSLCGASVGVSVAGRRPWGAPVGPGSVGPTRPLRIRRSADGVADPVAAAPETAAALRSWALEWAGEGRGRREGRLHMGVNDVDC